VIDFSGDEMVALFKQHLMLLRERREMVLAQLIASREMVERSKALIAQIDEQINRMEHEIGLRPTLGSTPP
jgi:hypothetical protein